MNDTQTNINSKIIEATEQNILHHEKWTKSILRLTWIFLAILLVFEGLVAVMYCAGMTLGADHTKWEFICKYFLLPCGIVLLTNCVANLLIRTVLRNRPIEQISQVIVVFVALIVSEVVAINHGSSVIFGMYVVPIILSVVYVSQKTLLTAYLCSLGLYLVVVFVYLRRFIPPADYHHNYMDVLANLGMMTAVYLLCRLVFIRIRELMVTAVTQSIQQIELAHQLRLDSLTQLYNHATFYDMLDEFILRYKNDGITFSLLVLDLDDFKTINDTYGHDMGDTVILSLVDTINAVITPADMAFRYGGEEFTILVTDSDRAGDVAEAIRAAMEALHFIGVSHPITLSIGLTHYHDGFGGRREYFSSADKALYQAKRAGKNRVCFGQ